MNEQETLASVAEFAIALAGFSGIVVALGKQPGRWAPADQYRLLNVLGFAFGAGFMAYLPMGLAHAGLSGSPLWRVSSGFFLCCGVIGDAEGVALIAEGDADGVNGLYDNRYVFIFKFKGGKIASLRQYNSDHLVATRLYKQKLVADA